MLPILILTTVFLAVLEAAGVIAIGWTFVFCPLWILPAALLAAATFWLGVAAVAGAIALVERIIR